jgi:hypothetical protein
MRKCLYFTLLISIICNYGYSQSWAKSAGGTNSNHGLSIDVDGSNNSLITGYFTGTVTFGAGEANETILSTVGSDEDGFVAKYNSNGTLLWAKRIGGSSNAFGNNIAVDGVGNSIVTGHFTGTVTFDPGEPDEENLISTANSNIFVAKFDPSGDIQWAKNVGGSSFNTAGGYGIGVDGSNNILIAGLFKGTATFDQGEPDAVVLASVGDNDIFVAKYDPTGDIQWAKRAGGTSFDGGYGIAVDGSGNSLITGYFTGTPTFGLGEANQTTFATAGGNDIFIAKYNSSGELQWAKKAGGTDYDHGRSITTDASGNGLITGQFKGSATFGAGDINETTLISFGNYDIYIAKYNSSGVLQWAKKAGGIDPDEGQGIVADASGNSLVTGRFYNSSTFGVGEANETTFLDFDGANIFIAKYNTSGELQWAEKADGSGGGKDEGRGIAIDGLGNGLVTGKFYSDVEFFQGSPDVTTLNITSYAYPDIFVAKYSIGDAPSVTYVDFDIHPTSWPNPININSGGTVPAAILGTESFDVTSIDPASLLFEGVTPVGWAFEDVTSPSGGGECNDTEVGPDGFLDLTLKFYTQELVTALGSVNNGDELILTIEGELIGGGALEGDDCVVIKGKSSNQVVNSIPLTSTPVKLTLMRNYPNPFNPVTTIFFNLREDSYVSLTVYDMLGRVVKTLISGQKVAGDHSAVWDSTNEMGEKMSAGIYLYSITAGSDHKTQKMILLK